MDFKSQIATTKFQSDYLLAFCLKPCTADMYLEKSNTPEYGEYRLHTISEGIDVKHWFFVRMNRDITPAWSLARLQEIMPEEIIQDNKRYTLCMYNNTVSYLSFTEGETTDLLVGFKDERSIFFAAIYMIEWLVKTDNLNPLYINKP